MFENIDRPGMDALVRAHEDWRRSCINLVASENLMSSHVKRYLSCDLVQRYADYDGRDPESSSYQGVKWIARIENAVRQLSAELFGAEYIELRPVSGHIAGVAVLMALTKPGDLVLELSRGHHRTATKLAQSPLLNLRVEYLPFDPFKYNIDVGKTLEMMEELRPRMIILGSSSFLFPHPVRELSEALCGHPETLLIYDASHVLGLIAGGRFQDPIREGAHIVLGSTHKTLPGPQGGLIISNDAELMDRISSYLQPGLVANHHLARLPALGVCLFEMRQWGAKYVAETICNAQALAEMIHSRGVDVVGFEGRFTKSHTILVQTARYGSSKEIATRLEQANIIVTATTLPDELGTAGIRIGTQEITRLGATRDDMGRLAELLVDVITGRKSPAKVLPSAKEYARQFQACGFTWESN